MFTRSSHSFFPTPQRFLVKPLHGVIQHPSTGVKGRSSWLVCFSMFLKCKHWCLPLGLAPWSLTDQNQDRQICGVTPPSSPVSVLRFTLPLSSPLTRGLATILFYLQLSLISSILTCGTGRLKANIQPLKMIQALGRGISHLFTETPVREIILLLSSYWLILPVTGSS